MLSVIVPVYNKKEHLCSCVESILNQTYSDIELILVDDGSTDGSSSLCDSFAEREVVVRVIHKKNEGPIRARMTGVENAAGEYVAFVDADDWIDVSLFEKEMCLIEQGYDMVSCPLNRYHSEQRQNLSGSTIGYGSFDSKVLLERLQQDIIWSVPKGKYGLDPSLCGKIMKRAFVLKYLIIVGFGHVCLWGQRCSQFSKLVCQGVRSS